MAKSLTSLLSSFLGTFAGSQAVTIAGHGVSATTLGSNTNTTNLLGGWLSNGIPNR
jgi:hypothetical protein